VITHVVLVEVSDGRNDGSEEISANGLVVLSVLEYSIEQLRTYNENMSCK
jgi:hypothetical protein